MGAYGYDSDWDYYDSLEVRNNDEQEEYNLEQWLDRQEYEKELNNDY
jgi:hypothetical protein